MKKSTKFLFGMYLFLWFMALSVANVAYWLAVIFLTFLLGFSYITANMAKKYLLAEQYLEDNNLVRGNVANIKISVNSISKLPIAPIKVLIRDMYGDLNVVEVKNKADYAVYPFRAAHIGKYLPGIESCLISDIFGLFEYKVDLSHKCNEISVLPRTHNIKGINFGIGDSGAETVKRAAEDLSSPSGIRKYQIGDPLKKIHWKLSLRKQEIMVRQYEEPTLPSSLILMDVSPPYVEDDCDSETIADIKDTVLETAASIAYSQLKLKNKLKLPILGSDPLVYTSSMNINMLLEKLSTVSFDETEQFERFIFYEMANIKQAGAVLIITTRLSSALVEVLTQIRSKGPTVRVYVISYKHMEEHDSLIALLKSRRVEVLILKPQSV